MIKDLYAWKEDCTPKLWTHVDTPVPCGFLEFLAWKVLLDPSDLYACDSMALNCDGRYLSIDIAMMLRRDS
jgi:hypothetical protein